MAKIIAITEHFQHFVEDLQESFWGDLQARTRQVAQQFFDALSEQQRDRYMVSRRYVRSSQRQDYRNGYYPRDFVTKFGTLFSARGGGQVSTPRRGCHAADPRGLSARHLDPASGPRGARADRRGGKSAD